MSWLSIFHRGHGKVPSATHRSFNLDLETAKRVGQSVELNNPELVVAGVRRSPGSQSWTIDVVNRYTGQMTSLSDHDHWARRLQEISPCRSAEDARVVQVPSCTPDRSH